MSGKASFWVCFIVLLTVPVVAKSLWAKQKCWWICVTRPSSICPGPCTWVTSQVPTIADECIHIPPNQNGAFPVDHSIMDRSGDIYRRQCIPCDAPEGATEPQFMQWAEVRDYHCGVRCYGWFATTKGQGPQEPIAVPCFEQVEQQ